LELPFFEDQLKYFSKNYKTISLKDYWEISQGQKEPISNALIITFDDGYLDNWQFAYPLLKKYGLKGTIFVSPEFVDIKSGVRPNIEDVWNGKATMDDLRHLGFLSWDELREMEKSSVMDIQSHTMTHTKYFVSDKLIGLHHPRADCLYYIGNRFPCRIPHYVEDPDFEHLLPFGYPIFEMQSSVVAKKVEVNQEFINHCVEGLANYNFNNYNYDDAFEEVKEKYDKLKRDNELITSIETDQEYENRIRYEVFESKRIIEEELNKKVEFLCWPHGDNNEFAHKIALEAGHLATSMGKSTANPADKDRFSRMGGGKVKNNRILSRIKLHYKVKSFQGKQPWKTISDIYSGIMHR
jgi:hypothetical protein